MSKRIVRNVPTERATAFCRLQTALGAIKCEISDKGDGKSDVLIEFPSSESYDQLLERRNG